MKRIIYAIMALIVAGCALQGAYAQERKSLKDLLKGASEAAQNYKNNNEEGSTATSSSGPAGLGNLIKGLAGGKSMTVADLAGTYAYSKPAVAFESENFLQKAGGAAASAMIVSKIGPYYQKAGLTNLTATFKADSTFVFNLRKGKLQGTIVPDTSAAGSNFVLQFKALGGKVPTGKIHASVERSFSGALVMTFNVSKLLTLANSIASISGMKSLQAVGSMLNSFEGLSCGFEMTRTGDDPVVISSSTPSPADSSASQGGVSSLLDKLRKKK